MIGWDPSEVGMTVEEIPDSPLINNAIFMVMQ